jgi:hypothetical protein
MIRSLQNLQTRINNIIELYEWAKWLINQAFKPRPIGTKFVKRRGQMNIHFEVVNHFNNKEIVEEVGRSLIPNKS